jgi:signal transduction histidine kinase/AmiR/NasT family two-component response regulator
VVAALAVFVVGLTVTFFVGRAETKHTKLEDQQHYENLREQLIAEVDRRVRVYLYGMMGTRSAFATSSYVDHEDFYSLVASRDLNSEFPGALGLGYIQRVHGDEQGIDSFVSKMRDEGMEQFTVSIPPGASALPGSRVDGRFIVKYVEPKALNANAIGLDIGSHVNRRQAAERAAFDGDARLTGVIQLVQDKQKVPGFLYLLPDYFPDMPTHTPEQCIEALRGWVYMAMIGPSVFEGIMDVTKGELHLDVICNGDNNERTVIYSGGAQSDHQLHSIKDIKIGGRTWTLSISSTEAFAHVPASGYWAIMTTGVVLSILLSFLIFTQCSATRRAVKMAEGMTSDLREYAEHAQQATRAKSDFLANMSHEIRTPMTAILGFTDLLRHQIDPDNHELLGHTRTIKRNGEHLLSLINDILDMSKIEAGKLQVEQIAVQPDTVVREVLSLMRVKADNKNLPISATLRTPIPCEIIADPVRLRQILVNLVGNAIKFTEHGGVSIEVYFDEAMEEIKFDIIDTGVGMTPEQVDKLFGAFTQADTTTTREFGGTGLGLHISQRLSTLLGGNITCESTYGQGSTFTVTIFTGNVDTGSMIPAGPLEEAIAEQPTKSSEPEKPIQNSSDMPLQGLRILLAEDGKDNQRLINHHLTKAGAHVTIVENGKLAVEALCEGNDVEGPLLSEPPFDMVVTDMQMPEMDGYTEASLLRQKGCQLPIMALTAHAMAEDANKCLEAGCDFYATKPIDKQKLIKLCAEAVPIQRRMKRAPGKADAA